MPRRRFTVTVPPAEAARLRAFDNKAEGRVSWPIGPNRTFMRRHRAFVRPGRVVFLVKDWVSMGAGKALVMTLGKASLRDDDRVDVVVRTKGAWLGWLLAAGGLACFAVVPREGFWGVVLGVLFLLAAWFLFLRRPGARADLDDLERILRKEIQGEWRPAGRAPADAAAA